MGRGVAQHSVDDEFFFGDAGRADAEHPAARSGPSLQRKFFKQLTARPANTNVTKPLPRVVTMIGGGSVNFHTNLASMAGCGPSTPATVQLWRARTTPWRCGSGLVLQSPTVQWFVVVASASCWWDRAVTHATAADLANLGVITGSVTPSTIWPRWPIRPQASSRRVSFPHV